MVEILLTKPFLSEDVGISPIIEIPVSFRNISTENFGAINGPLS